MTFLIQVEIFLVFAMMRDFLKIETILGYCYVTPDFVVILCFSSPLLTALQQGRWNGASMLPRGSESPGLHVASAGHWGEVGVPCYC